jgi:hypothetical protein
LRSSSWEKGTPHEATISAIVLARWIYGGSYTFRYCTERREGRGGRDLSSEEGEGKGEADQSVDGSIGVDRCHPNQWTDESEGDDHSIEERTNGLDCDVLHLSGREMIRERRGEEERERH